MDKPLSHLRIYLLFVIFTFLTISPANASITNGTIDSTNKYAWGENIGWINFGTSEGAVQITDDDLQGYAWGENIGWISLNCLNDDSCSTVSYGISNDGNGNLTGYAWGENIGWIHFNPDYGGVTINSSGNFLGYAWGENIGWIVFNCDTTSSCNDVSYLVSTDWRPQSARPACNNATDDDSDGLTDYPNDPGCNSLTDTDETDASTPVSTPSGTGLPASAYEKPVPPSSGFSVVINQGEETTATPDVFLTLTAGNDVHFIKISEDEAFPGGYQMSFVSINGQATMPYSLSKEEGLKTVYVQFCTKWNQCSATVSDTITLQPEQHQLPMPAETKDQPITIDQKTPTDVVMPEIFPGKNRPVQQPSKSEPTAPPQVFAEPNDTAGLIFSEPKKQSDQPDQPNPSEPPPAPKPSWIQSFFNTLLSPFRALYDFFINLFR